MDDVAAGRHSSYFVACETWLQHDGVAYAATQIRILRLHCAPSDLVNAAWMRLHSRFARQPDLAAPGPPEAYCKTVINRLAIDVLRGRAARPEQPLKVGTADGRATFEPHAPPIVASTPSALPDDLRVVIESVGDHPAWAVSAALTFVTLTMHPGLDTEPAPRPLAGADPEQARMWPALWFAGKRNGVFPATDEPDAAQRQRLSRLRRDVRRVLDEARAQRHIDGPTS